MRWLVPIGLLLLASCAQTPHETDASEPRPSFHANHLQAVVAAGDDTTGTFADAVAYFRDELGVAGIAAPPDPPGLGNLVANIAALRPPPDGGCLVFLTSHGVADGSVAIGDASLDPQALDSALAAGCGTAPTVVLVSACRSGRFADPPMARPNRVILTASRADRDSFDCGAGAVFTFFDECLLSALPGAVDWEAVYDRARGCIAVRERHVGVLPSEPRAAFGDQVHHLPTPWALPESEARAIVFSPGPDRFSVSRPPFYGAERGPLATQLRSYARARSPKAMAILPDGLIVWMDKNQAGTGEPDEIARLVLERCELIAGGACVLYARDDRVTSLLPSGLAPFHPPMLVRTGRFDPAALPFVASDRRDLAEAYAGWQPPKALALSPARGVVGVGFGGSLHAARDEALARCGTDASDCVIYAEGDDVVFGWGG